MKWFLEEKIESFNTQISHGDKAIFLGSCFSENIYTKGKLAGLSFVNSNFGTIFHPLPIARNLQDAILENKVERVVERDDRFYTWDASSKFKGNTAEFLSAAIDAERDRLQQHLKECKFLFITLGTSKGYRNKDGLLVANCHKIPQNQFSSELTPVSEMVRVYRDLIEQINQFNPSLQVVLTVSPVRHSKDGLITNNRSKARLLQLCEELEKIDQVSYFPAYEMVVDELRDYRFYNSDLIHPNDDAVNYVWEKFQEVYLSNSSVRLCNEVEKKRAFFNHKPSGEENQKEKKLRSQKEKELEQFLLEHPEIDWK